MKKIKDNPIKNYNELTKRQYILGWILVPFYLGILRYLFIEPLMKCFVDEPHARYLSGPLKSIIVLAIFLLLMKDNLRIFFNDLKSDGIRENFKWILKGLLYFFFIRFIYALFLAVFKVLANDALIEVMNSEPQNEIFLNELYELYPILSFVFIVFFGPFLEELIFRYLVFHTFLKVNRYFAIIVSSLFFSFLHVLGEVSSGRIDALIVYFASYMTIALALAILYEKKRNIFYCIFLHMINNILSTYIL